MSVHEDALRDLAANHGWGFCDAVADEINDLEASYASLFKTHGELQRDLAAAQEDLQFVERWANHHGVKPTCTAEAALSIIQHYPPILAITRSYADGKVPETRNPWAELQEAQEARKRAEERAAACKKDAERWKKYLEIYDSEELAEAAWGGAGEITKTVDAAIAARTK